VCLLLLLLLLVVVVLVLLLLVLLLLLAAGGGGRLTLRRATKNLRADEGAGGQDASLQEGPRLPLWLVEKCVGLGLTQSKSDEINGDLPTLID